MPIRGNGDCMFCLSCSVCGVTNSIIPVEFVLISPRVESDFFDGTYCKPCLVSSVLDLCHSMCFAGCHAAQLDLIANNYAKIEKQLSLFFERNIKSDLVPFGIRNVVNKVFPSVVTDFI